MNNKNIYSEDGSGTPVVLLHSSMNSKEQWYKLINLLKADYRVISLNLSGYGGAKFPDKPEEFCLLNEVEHVESILSSLIKENEKFFLVGHSYGAATGLRYCYKNPERVLAMAMYEPVAFHLLQKGSDAWKEVEWIARQVSKKLDIDQDTVTATELFVDYWSGEGAFNSIPEEKKGVLVQDIGKVKLDFQASMGEVLGIDEYKKIQTPICLIKGSKSRLSAQTISQILGKALPSINNHFVEGGHMAPLTMSAEVNEIFQSFLTEQTPL